MSTLKSHTLLAAALVVAGMGAPLLTQAQTTGGGTWAAARDVVLTSGNGLCWRAGYWTAAQGGAGCEVSAAVKPVVAAVQPQAAPAPAPVATPAPAPVVAAAPVVEPAPAPKAEPAPVPAPVPAWKTAIVEKPIRLEGASFAAGSSKLLPGAGAKLDEVVGAAKEHAEIDITVSGYTDNTGKEQSNVRLSQARAEAVKGYLVSKGVAGSRISAKGYGAENPVADNTSAAGRAKNRRVEIRYVLKEESKVRVAP